MSAINYILCSGSGANLDSTPYQIFTQALASLAAQPNLVTVTPNTANKTTTATNLVVGGQGLTPISTATIDTDNRIEISFTAGTENDNLYNKIVQISRGISASSQKAQRNGAFAPLDTLDSVKINGNTITMGFDVSTVSETDIIGALTVGDVECDSVTPIYTAGVSFALTLVNPRLISTGVYVDAETMRTTRGTATNTAFVIT